jgi:branched-chain amino acid aminotransferase
MSMRFPYQSVNGTLVPSTEATLHIDNIALLYGFGVYETLRVKNGVAYFLTQHEERLFHSAQIIGLQHSLSSTAFHAAVQKLIKATPEEVYNMKIMFIGGKTADDATLYMFPTAPLFPDRKLYRDGARALTVPFERFYPQAKTLSMLPSYLAYRRAVEQDCYDALAVNRDGCVTEGTRTNFFVMNDRTIISPPVENILEGVTRTIVLDIAQHNGFSVEERALPLNELAQYESAFLTSTSTKIMPLAQIDERSFSLSPTLRELMQLYDTFWDTCKGMYQQ